MHLKPISSPLAASEASRLVREPNASTISRILPFQKGIEAYFQTLPSILSVETNLEEILLNELFGQKSIKPKMSVQIIVEKNFIPMTDKNNFSEQNSDRSFRMIEDVTEKQPPKIKSIEDFNSYLKESYNSYRMLVDNFYSDMPLSLPDSMESLNFEELDDFSEVNQSQRCFNKQQKYTCDTERSDDKSSLRSQDASQNVFRKKTRIVL